MPSQIIGTTIAGTIASATGYGFQPHLFWATNDAAWWLFYIASGDLTHLLTYRSPDGVTWTAKSSVVIGSNHDSDMRNIGVAYKNISSTDVFHISIHCVGAGNFYHIRATTTGGAITFGSSTLVAGESGTTPDGISCAFSGDNHIYTDANPSGNLDDNKSTNADLGSSWSAGWGGFTVIESIPNSQFGGCQFPVDSTLKMLHLHDNGGNATASTSMTNVRAVTWDGTTISSIVDVFTVFTAENTNNFAAVRLSNTAVHVIVVTGGNTWTHKIVNGNGAGAPTIGAGATMPTQNVKATSSGVGAYTDGTNIWVFCIDSDAPNTIRYIKYNGSAWGTWTALETTTQARNYVNVSPIADVSGNIGVMWTQTNGSNFDIVYESLATASSGQGTAPIWLWKA